MFSVIKETLVINQSCFYELVSFWKLRPKLQIEKKRKTEFHFPMNRDGRDQIG